MLAPTEAIRRQRLAEINIESGSREAMEAQYGQVWDTKQLGEDFEIVGFMAPLVVVRRKSDGTKGSLEFQNNPRLFFNFKPQEGKRPCPSAKRHGSEGLTLKQPAICLVWLPSCRDFWMNFVK